MDGGSRQGGDFRIAPFFRPSLLLLLVSFARRDRHRRLPAAILAQLVLLTPQPTHCTAQTAATRTQARRTHTVVRAEYLGSATNQIMILATALPLVAGRFGLAPTANRPASAGLKMSDRASGLVSNDPAGLTAADVLALGAFGHAMGVGIVLGMKGIGAM